MFTTSEHALDLGKVGHVDRQLRDYIVLDEIEDQLPGKQGCENRSDMERRLPCRESVGWNLVSK